VLTSFYGAFAPLSFTVLGLWFIVVQTRHAEWSVSREHRRRASIVALQLALPGLMSLLALVDPSSAAMWRVSFAATAIVGAASLVALSFGLRRDKVILLAGHVLSCVLFAVVAVVAAYPSIITKLGFDVAALPVEATLLSLLVFIGVAVAWLLLFDAIPID
jgi:hypothetical protein